MSKSLWEGQWLLGTPGDISATKVNTKKIRITASGAFNSSGHGVRLVRETATRFRFEHRAPGCVVLPVISPYELSAEFKGSYSKTKQITIVTARGDLVIPLA